MCSRIICLIDTIGEIDMISRIDKIGSTVTIGKIVYIVTIGRGLMIDIIGITTVFSQCDVHYNWFHPPGGKRDCKHQANHHT